MALVLIAEFRTGEGSAVDPIAAGLGSDIEDAITDTGCPALLNIFLVHETDAHNVDERITAVAIIKGDLASYCWNADAVAVARNPVNDFLVDVLGPGII